MIRELQGRAQGRRRALPRHRRGPRGRGDLVAPPRGAEAPGPGEADGVPRDHPRRHRARPSSNWRDIDYGLVDAQETRRIVDRLFGYPVSEVLWRKINRGLSAGRVQSPAVRLVVERERERMAFVAAGYWDLDADFPTAPAVHARRSSRVDGTRVGGRQGLRRPRPAKSAGRRCRVLDEADAERLRAGAGRTRLHGPLGRRASRSAARPKPPFMTSTLQQEGGRKLRHEQPAGHARRAGPLRAGLHHLHAHRLGARSPRRR